MGLDDELRKETWTEIDNLVREFLAEAGARGIRPMAQGLRRSRATEFFVVQSARSKRDALTITTNGNWALLREMPNGYTDWVTDSANPDKMAPPEPDLVDGLRKGAARLLDGTASDAQRPKSAADERMAKPLRWLLWGFVLFFLSIGLFIALLICNAQVSGYRDATPTTATIDSCQSFDDPAEILCTGTWILGGNQYRGDIDEMEDLLPPGATVEVRANNVRAYAMSYTPSIWDWTPAFIVGGLIVIAVGLFVISEMWNRGESRRASAQG